MTKDIVLSMERVPGRGLVLEVAAGYEVLGEYLSSDMRGTLGDPYETVRAMLVKALRDGSKNEFSSDAFTIVVSGDSTTITLDATDEDDDYHGDYSTRDVLAALTQYAELGTRLQQDSRQEES
jgi:hypothetical protein